MYGDVESDSMIRRHSLMCLFVMVFAGLLVVLFASGARAAEIKVNTKLDEFGENTEKCSLREAVQTANGDVEFGGCVRDGSGIADTILLVGSNKYERSRDGTDDNNAAGDLDILGTTTFKVRGDGRAIISGNDMDRVIDVVGTLRASRVIIQNGTPDTSSQPDSEIRGGGVFVTPTGRVVLNSSIVRNNVASSGGGLASQGILKLDLVTVDDNQAEGGAGVEFLSGQMIVDRSTISNNRAEVVGGGFVLNDGNALITRSTIEGNGISTTLFGGGGGIYANAEDAETELRVVNSTISGNFSNSSGGGILVGSGPLRLNAVTVTRNEADTDETGNGASGGGLYGDVVFENSIVVKNITYTDEETSDCYQGSPVGNNLVGLGTGCSTAGKTFEKATAKLKPLWNNGGPTKTHAFMDGTSAAIGRAGASAPGKDQRGVTRDDDPDLGSYERKS